MRLPSGSADVSSSCLIGFCDRGFMVQESASGQRCEGAIFRDPGSTDEPRLLVPPVPKRETLTGRLFLTPGQ